MIFCFAVISRFWFWYRKAYNVNCSALSLLRSLKFCYSSQLFRSHLQYDIFLFRHYIKTDTALNKLGGKVGPNISYSYLNSKHEKSRLCTNYVTQQIIWFLSAVAAFWTRSLAGHNWFLNQFVDIPQRSIIVYFISFCKSRLRPPFEISCSSPPSLDISIWPAIILFRQRRDGRLLFEFPNQIWLLGGFLLTPSYVLVHQHARGGSALCVHPHVCTHCRLRGGLW